MQTRLANLPFEVFSPSAFQLVDTNVKLVFDGALWWLFDEQNAKSFESKSAAIIWLSDRMAKLSWPTTG
jgi:hypothetical protein